MLPRSRSVLRACYSVTTRERGKRYFVTGLLSPVALFLLGTTHDYAIAQAGPSVSSTALSTAHWGGACGDAVMPRVVARGCTMHRCRAWRNRSGRRATDRCGAGGDAGTARAVTPVRPRGPSRGRGSYWRRAYRVLSAFGVRTEARGGGIDPRKGGEAGHAAQGQSGSGFGNRPRFGA